MDNEDGLPRDSEPPRLVRVSERDTGRDSGLDAAARETDESRVTRFLADNPEWLSMQTGLYGRLSPPRRVHGETLADHMAAMIEAARRQAADMTAHAETVLQAGRAASGLAERVREAVLALIRSADIGEWIADDLPRLLGIDAALLCVEGPASGISGSLMARSMPRGTVASLLGRGDVLVRVAPGNAAVLHGEAASLAAHDALLRVPVAGLPPMLLALASRDAHVLQDGLPASMTGGAAGSGGAASLAFLGAALAARIESPA